MKTVILEREALYEQAAGQIAGILTEKPDAVIAMSAGRTMLPLWQKLRRLDLNAVRLFQVAEFIGTEEHLTMRAMTEKNLLEGSNLRPENCFWLTEENFQEYENAIADVGGLDLAVLGIGDNAHIGFNEPATQFDSRTHRQKLTEKTRKQYGWYFGTEESTPAWGLSMGIRTITEARKIMLLACGEEKAQAVFDMLYARNDSIIPAAFLQIPAEVTVYADREAGAKL